MNVISVRPSVMTSFKINDEMKLCNYNFIVYNIAILHLDIPLKYVSK